MRADSDLQEEFNRVSLGNPSTIGPVSELAGEHARLSKADVTVVVPTLNEAEAIVDVLNELKQNGLLKIIVVDGHSTDGTAKLAADWGAKVITQEGAGKVRAIGSAIKHVDTKLVLILDGDKTYDVSAIDQMIELMQESDEVICARTNGRDNIPAINRLGNRIIGFVFNTLFGTHLTDVLSGMYLTRAEVLREIWMESEGFSLEIEVASYVATTTRRLAETPGNYRPRVGKGKLRLRHGFDILSDAIKITWRYNPALFIFGIFSALFIPALFIYAWVAYYFLLFGQKHFVWAIIGTVVGGVSLTSFSLAIITLYLKRLEYKILDRLARLKALATA
jgi:dolichol-phosphate mannosyltransferase